MVHEYLAGSNAPKLPETCALSRGGPATIRPPGQGLQASLNFVTWGQQTLESKCKIACCKIDLRAA